MNYQDVRSDQPPAHRTPSTASGRPLTHDRSACGAACMWSASHITCVALTVRQLCGMEREGDSTAVGLIKLLVTVIVRS